MPYGVGNTFRQDMNARPAPMKHHNVTATDALRDAQTTTRSAPIVRHAKRHSWRPDRGSGHPADSHTRSRVSLVVENIPPLCLSTPQVHAFFGKFGSISRIDIEPDSASAIITFTRPDEARRAASSSEPFFNNRFVKVYYQRMNSSALHQRTDNASLDTPVIADPTLSGFNQITKTSGGAFASTSSRPPAQPPNQQYQAMDSVQHELQLQNQIRQRKAMMGNIAKKEGTPVPPAENAAALLKQLRREVRKAQCLVDRLTSRSRRPLWA